MEDLRTAGVISDARVYWEILLNLWPLICIGGIVAVTTNMAKIKGGGSGYKIVWSLLSVASVGCVSAGVAALGLSLFVTRPSPELQMVSSAIAGSMGQRVFDFYGARLFGAAFKHGASDKDA